MWSPAPGAIGIGSSRVLQFNRENTGVDTFFNMGVTGADVRDNMTSYYKMVTYGKTPKVLWEPRSLGLLRQRGRV